MAVNTNAPFYGTNSPDKQAAVYDVDIKQPNLNDPEKVSAKAQAVVIAGTMNALGAIVPLLTGSGGGGGGSSLADVTVMDTNGVFWIMQDQGGGVFAYYNIATGVVGTPTGALVPATVATTGKTSYFFSTLNSSTAQLAAAASFTGTVEDIRSYPNMSSLVSSDQPFSVTAQQYVDAAGTVPAGSPITFAVTTAISGTYRAARSFVLNGNYIKLTVTNTGGSTTTTLNINTAFGNILPSDETGLSAVSIADGNVATIGSQADAAAGSDTATASLISLTKRLLGKFKTGLNNSASALAVVLASDQAALPVNANPPQILTKPAANSIAALNGAVQWGVEGGCSYYLSLSNPAAATAQFVGTVTFQSSIDGGTSWQSLSVTPQSTPTAQSVTTATAVGLWLADVPDAVSVLVRANMTAYTSGTVVADLVPYGQQGAVILLPWTYTVTSGATLVGPIDTSGLSEIDIQISAVTTTVLTVQGTNDPSLTTWDTVGVVIAGGTTTPAMNIAGAGTFRASTGGYKWLRIQCTITGTVLTVQGVAGRLGTASAGALAVSGGTISAVTTVAALTKGNLGLPVLVVDIASVALTTTATSATITPGFGCSYEVNIPVTAVSGTAPTLDVVIQESDDGGTNWFDVYHFPRITATGMYRSPKMPVTGNVVRYVQTVAGTTPNFTRSVNRLQSSDYAQPLRKIYDRTLATTQTLNAVTATLNNQCATRNLQLLISAGTITTTAPSIQLQGSDDGGVSWYSIGTTLLAVASNTVQLTVNNIYAEQVRAIVTVAGSAATLNYVAIKAF